MTLYQVIILTLWVILGIVLFIVSLLNKKKDNETNERLNLNETTTSELVFTDVVLEDVKSRKAFKAKEKVENGFYAEINKDLSELYNVLNIEESLLPNALDEQSVFISISQSEFDRLRLSGIDTKDFIKFTPGTYVQPGYYLEVDIQDISTNYVIKTERRLPPTKHKGFRWVKINRRKIK